MLIRRAAEMARTRGDEASAKTLSSLAHRIDTPVKAWETRELLLVSRMCADIGEMDAADRLALAAESRDPNAMGEALAIRAYVRHALCDWKGALMLYEAALAELAPGDRRDFIARYRDACEKGTLPGRCP